jgi:hypothetical protein
MSEKKPEKKPKSELNIAGESKPHSWRRMNWKKLLLDSTFAGFLLFLGLTVNFFTHFLDILKTVFPPPSSLITIGPGSPVPYLESTSSFMNSIPLTIILFVLSAYATSIEAIKLWHKYFSRHPLDAG